MSNLIPTNPAVQEHFQTVQSWNAATHQRIDSLTQRVTELEKKLGIWHHPSEKPASISDRFVTIQAELEKRKNPSSEQVQSASKVQRVQNITLKQLEQIEHLPVWLSDHKQIYCEQDNEGLEPKFLTAFTFKNKRAPTPSNVLLALPGSITKLIFKDNNLIDGQLTVYRTGMNCNNVQYDIEDLFLSLFLIWVLKFQTNSSSNITLESIEKPFDKTITFHITITRNERKLEFRNLNYYLFKILVCNWQQKHCDILSKIPPEHLHLLLQSSICIDDGNAFALSIAYHYLFVYVHPVTLPSTLLATLNKDFASFIIPSMINRLKEGLNAQEFNFITVENFCEILRRMITVDYPVDFSELVDYAPELEKNYKTLHPHSNNFPDLTLLGCFEVIESKYFALAMSNIHDMFVKLSDPNFMSPKKTKFTFKVGQHE